ncbi:MAG: hypothetical protein QM730_09495 [Anaerolineales bacterium]
MFEWTIEYLVDENILLLESKGQMDVPAANAMVKDLADAAQKYQCNHHLINHRETVMTFSLPEYFERPAINEELGISRLFKTAMIFSQLSEDTVFMENVFRNRGYNMRHFADMEEAKRWLKQE